jgi:hypothetical protein
VHLVVLVERPHVEEGYFADTGSRYRVKDWGW